MNSTDIKSIASVEEANVNWAPKFALASLGLNVIVIIILIWQHQVISGLVNKKPPTLVQLANGSSISVEARDGNFRDPSIVKDFTQTALTLFLTWNLEGEPRQDSTGPTSKNQGKNTQRGVAQGDGRMTYGSWIASFAFSDDYQNEMRDFVAQNTPKEVFTGQIQVIPEFISISTPVQTESGKWQVDVIAKLNVMQLRNNGTYSLVRSIPFSREVWLAAVPHPFVPKNATPLQQALGALRSSGLEIDFMRPIILNESKRSER